MAEKNYKLNEPIKIVYQAPGAQTGLVVTAEIILPGNVKDSFFPDFTLTEILGKGIYQKEFTPNASGEWESIVHIPSGGQVVKRYSVGAHNVESVGNDVAVVGGGVAVVGDKVDDVQTTADNIETKVDDLNSAFGGFDTPAMIS